MGHFRALPGASRAAGATLNSLGAAHTAVSLYIRLYSSMRNCHAIAQLDLGVAHGLSDCLCVSLTRREHPLFPKRKEAHLTLRWVVSNHLT